MAADDASSIKFTHYYSWDAFRFIAKYYRHPVYFMQHYDLRPWSQEDCVQSVKLVRQLLQFSGSASGILTGGDTSWFDKFFDTNVRLSWGTILHHGAAWKAIYTHLPVDEDLQTKLDARRAALHIAYDGSGMFDYPNAKFWEERLLGSAMQCTLGQFLTGEEALKTEVDLTWGAIMLYGVGALEGVSEVLRRVAGNEALIQVLNEVEGDGGV